MNEDKPKRNRKVISQGKVTKIQATSRVSAKIKDSFYTFEFLKEVTFEADKNYNLEVEKENLWDEVHGEVDKQLQEIISMQKY